MIVKTTSRNGENTERVYDANSNLTQLWDHNALAKEAQTPGTGRPTVYTYDGRNLQTAVQYPDHVSGSNPGDSGYGIVVTTYDALRRKDVTTDQMGDTVTWVYDLAGRMTDRKYRLRNAGSDESVDQFTYDDASRPLTASKGRYSNTVSYSYDVIGRKVGETLAIDGNDYSVQYSYDDANRLVTLTYPDGTAQTRGYDERNLLESVTHGGTTIATMIHDAGGRMSSRTLGNGISTAYAFNTDNTLSGISVSGRPELTLGYSYDANDNVTGETRGGVMGDYAWTAGFDADDRIVSFDRSGGLDYDWTLDKIGNWDSVTKNGTQETRTHNDVHELTTMGATGLSYDAKGNLTVNAANATLTWDIDNHLKHIEPDTPGLADDDTDYQYDALGRRVSKQTGPMKRIFVSAGDQVLAEYETAELARSYVYADYIDDTLAMVESAGTTYYHRDRQYNTIALTNSSGTTLEYAAYTPYGELTITNASGTVQSGPTTTNRYYYTGRYLDGNSMWYFRARYLDDKMGRFISRDPMGYVDGTSLQNAYFASYLLLDPFGLKLSKEACEDLLRDIKRKTAELNKDLSNYDPVEDAKGGHPFWVWDPKLNKMVKKITTPGGHYKEILERQRGIRKLLKKYDDECNDDDDDDDDGDKCPVRVPAWVRQKTWERIKAPNVSPSLPFWARGGRGTDKVINNTGNGLVVTGVVVIGTVVVVKTGGAAAPAVYKAVELASQTPQYAF